jgi:hypothetical protein
MAKAGGGVVFLPWYATGFRADAFADALAEIAPVALRYGATEYAVYRSRDDRYKFIQSAAFADGVDFDRYWYGPEFGRFRSQYASWYQVPVVPYWNDQVVAGAVELEPVGE